MFRRAALLFPVLCLGVPLLAASEPRGGKATAGQALAGDVSVVFTARTAGSGKWSAAATWEKGRAPRAGDFVLVRAGHTVVYDVVSDEAVRMVHVAGRLTFSREASTRLTVGLLKIQPGDTCGESGFACDDHADADARQAEGDAMPAVEMGTADAPIPPGVTATLRLKYFEGTDKETLPAVIACGGRWDVHGSPLGRSWVKLAAPAPAGAKGLVLAGGADGWRVGDKVIVTGSKMRDEPDTFRKGKGAALVQTEERFIAGVEGNALALDQPLAFSHRGTADAANAADPLGCEVANLSRNVVIESADPDGVRGHTMYHTRSAGGISWAEFRHLGKEGVLGKYPIHFHLVRDSMRGSAVTGVSVWDSANRWVTLHAANYLLVRDCVGYGSLGHGFFLEDGTEEYNVLDRNLAVHAYRTKRLPKQALPFDSNDGAGFWWANGRNTLVRNVACENDRYGYHFQVEKSSAFDTTMNLQTPDGKREPRDVAAVPFLRFEGNESHCNGLYAFKLGDEARRSVHGDKTHPFVVRDLLTWEDHYCLRPDLQYFLADGVRMINGVYGVYHPDYDAHVYRRLYLNHVESEPINRANDDTSIQYGSFTYDDLTLENCKNGRDPLIQLACTSPRAGQEGHFRNVTLKNSASRAGKVVDLGGGPRNAKLENAVAYYFHGYPAAGKVTKVLSVKFPAAMSGDAYAAVEGFTGKDVRAADAGAVAFPALLDPVDDLPPATLVTSVRPAGAAAGGSADRLKVTGVTQDDGTIAAVSVNGHAATLTANAAGVAGWEGIIDAPADGVVVARATDAAGNVEKNPHRVRTSGK